MYAHFYAAPRGLYVLVLSCSPDLSKGTVEEISVSGKREARKISMERGAKPWNF